MVMCGKAIRSRGVTSGGGNQGGLSEVFYYLIIWFLRRIQLLDGETTKAPRHRPLHGGGVSDECAS